MLIIDKKVIMPEGEWPASIKASEIPRAVPMRVPDAQAGPEWLGCYASHREAPKDSKTVQFIAHRTFQTIFNMLAFWKVWPIKIQSRFSNLRSKSLHFVIHCLDRDGAVEKRLAHYEAHRNYLADPPVTIVISGPLLAEDNETMIGSCLLIEAETLAQVEAFNRQDPFFKADLWRSIAIHPFLKRMDNRT